MNIPTVAAGLLLATGSFVVAGLRRWHRALPVERAHSSAITPLSPTVDMAHPDSLDAAERAIVAVDPFRLADTPVSVRFDPTNEIAQPAVVSVAVPVRPTLVLKAIVGGPPWQAVIDGLPGQPPGTIARAGSNFDRLTVHAIGRDTVVIRGPDTTWVLTFRSRW